MTMTTTRDGAIGKCGSSNSCCSKYTPQRSNLPVVLTGNSDGFLNSLRFGFPFSSNRQPGAACWSSLFDRRVQRDVVHLYLLLLEEPQRPGHRNQQSDVSPRYESVSKEVSVSWYGSNPVPCICLQPVYE
jgi:hypothetical protein